MALLFFNVPAAVGESRNHAAEGEGATSRAAPRWPPPAKTDHPYPRRRQAPLALAIALAVLVWIVIALGGAVLNAWLA